VNTRRIGRIPVPRLLYRFSAASLLVVTHLLPLGAQSPQLPGRKVNVHNVLSERPLSPPLRNSQVTVRYSPDGRYLMVQDPSGIYLLSRDALKLVAYLAIEETYPAQFSHDSQSIVTIGHDLTLRRTRLPTAELLEEKVLPAHDDCLDAALSPGADFFACFTPEFKLIVYQLSTLQPIFSESTEPPATNRFLAPPIFYVPLDPGTAFAGPFGFLLSNTHDARVKSGHKLLSMFFSPNGNTLYETSAVGGFRLDLSTRQKSSLPASIRKRYEDSMCALENDRVLIVGGKKDQDPEMLSLTSGNLLANPPLKADTAFTAANPRYALLSAAHDPGLQVFDTGQNRLLDVPDNLGLDVFTNELALLNDRGILFLYHLGERLPFLSAELPLDRLPILRTAAVTPTLDRIAFSVAGNGAAYQLATGERLYSGRVFSAADFSDPSSLFLLEPSGPAAPSQVVRLMLPSAESAIAWTCGRYPAVSGGSVLFEYLPGPLNLFGPASLILEGEPPYHLRALDLATGKELWNRNLSEDPPIPFADPQGNRIVLGWYAKSAGAEAEAKRIPSVWESFKKAKLDKEDTFFGVLDARSGDSLGGVLIQVGSGPLSYDAAYSVGNALFLIKDGKRVSLYSLQDGSLKARFVGGMPVASASAGLFAIEEGPGRLVFYDLASAAKLDDQLFPDAIAYTHFSADGRRLLVLTRHQVAYILDVSSLRNLPQASPAASPN
jgi:hypothetical protein